MQRVLPELKIAFFVIDECHCISDWGHDFRLEYGKLNRIIDMLPENVSVLGTTATANDRVIEDLRVQFGENTYVSRGPLTSESLHIQILDLETKVQRYAWLAKNLNKIPGNGIIYCLTVNDCDRLADFLKRHNIAARAYHSGTHLKDTKKPSSPVGYYQQIGRAGREDGVEAYCYLMTGDKDREDLENVQAYLDGLYVEITPRKQWGASNNPFDNNRNISRPNETGIALAKYNDAGYGEMVAHDKYHADAFRKELVDKTLQVLRERIGDQEYTIVTNIPSARNRKVAEFAKKVAEGLGYSYQNLLDVTGRGDQQKTMQNTYFQYQNAVSKICVREGAPSLNGENVILIDDLADSKWTLTVAGALLKKEGAGKVYPFCLADSSQSER